MTDSATRTVLDPVDAESGGVDASQLRDCLARWPSGVAVVTTLATDGSPRGFTATAFSSLSLNPPLVLVCLDQKADCRPAFDTARTMAVQQLRAGRSDLAQRFATKGVDKFEGVATTPGLGGAPLFDDVLTCLECTLTRRIDAGDHIILIGLVQRAGTFPGDPLVYCDRRFPHLTT